MEFMDIPWYLPEGASERLRELAQFGADQSWGGYQKVKSEIRIPGTNPDETPSLLVTSVTDRAIQMWPL